MSFRNLVVFFAPFLALFVGLSQIASPAFAGPFDVAKGQSTLALAKDGKALQPIVISAQASKDTQTNAADLAEYLKRITGATFEIKADDGSSGIVLGNIKEFPNPSLDKPLEVRDHYNGLEAFSIRTEPNRVLLIGATDMGVSHVVWRFLELLGHRRFFPHRVWDVVPSTPDLRVSLQEDSRPDILSRKIWYGYGLQNNELALQGLAWQYQNRMGANRSMQYSLNVKVGHAYTTIEKQYSAEFKAHPEYYALVKDKDGKMVRKGPQMCLSNPAVQKMAADYAVKYLEDNPGKVMAPVGPADGGGLCQCDQCKKLGDGSISDQVFTLTNAAARAVEARFPGQGKMVSTYAYSFYTDPPSFPLEPNVFIELTAGYNYSAKRYTYPELVDLWGKATKNLGFREYFSVWQWDYDLPARARASDIEYIRKTIPYYVQKGGDSISAESGFNWGPNGLGYYIANYLMWDGKADVDALLKDFYEKAFGPAAAPMERFYERYDRGRDPLISLQWHGGALRDLQEASTLAKDRPDILARIDQLKQYMHYLRLRWEGDMLVGTGSIEERKAAFLRMMEFSYRVRDTGMNHWNAMRRAGANKTGQKLNEPSWNWKKNRGAKPWEIDTPWTKADTENAFQEDLKYFKNIDLQEKTFSNDLVPVKMTGAPVATTLYFQRGTMAQALYSRNGEPLKFRLEPGIRWKPAVAKTAAAAAPAVAPKDAGNDEADEAPAAPQDAADDDDDDADADAPRIINYVYKLSTPAGKVIVQKTMPIDFKAQDIEIKVPAAGVYFLNVTGENGVPMRAGWSIEVPAETPNAVFIPRDRSLYFNGRVRSNYMYFYVPKGTKTIQYFRRGDSHQVFHPEQKGKPIVIGQLPRLINQIEEIPVPPGEDGKLWSMKYFVRAPWFFNIPNIFIVTPDTALLPRELAEKDGLTIQK
jgi:hypothetical protein